MAFPHELLLPDKEELNSNFFTRMLQYESRHSQMFYKYVLLKISQNTQENTCTGVFILIKFATSSKRDSSTGVLLWILQKIFTGHLQRLLLHSNLRKAVIGRFLDLSYHSPKEIVSARKVFLRRFRFHLKVLVKIEQKKFSTMVSKYVNTEAAIQMFYQVSAFKLSAKSWQNTYGGVVNFEFCFLDC